VSAENYARGDVMKWAMYEHEDHPDVTFCVCPHNLVLRCLKVDGCWGEWEAYKVTKGTLVTKGFKETAILA
jgi:hypothetical protein